MVQPELTVSSPGDPIGGQSTIVCRIDSARSKPPNSTMSSVAATLSQLRPSLVWGGNDRVRYERNVSHEGTVLRLERIVSHLRFTTETTQRQASNRVTTATVPSHKQTTIPCTARNNSSVRITTKLRTNVSSGKARHHQLDLHRLRPIMITSTAENRVG